MSQNRPQSGNSLTNPSRSHAGRAGIPQLVAPGCTDLVDVVSSQPLASRWTEHMTHFHNRLITSVVLNTQERREVADAITRQLAQATANTALLLPLHGCGEWDREGADLHDAQGYAAFCEQIRQQCPDNVVLTEIDAHINDAEFAKQALAVFDQWCEQGIVNKELND